MRCIVSRVEFALARTGPEFVCETRRKPQKSQVLARKTWTDLCQLLAQQPRELSPYADPQAVKPGHTPDDSVTVVHLEQTNMSAGCMTQNFTFPSGRPACLHICRHVATSGPYFFGQSVVIRIE